MKMTDRFAEDVIENSKKVNDKSESNGALMRITPLAIWFEIILLRIVFKMLKFSIRRLNNSSFVRSFTHSSKLDC